MTQKRQIDFRQDWRTRILSCCQMQYSGDNPGGIGEQKDGQIKSPKEKSACLVTPAIPEAEFKARLAAIEDFVLGSLCFVLVGLKYSTVVEHFLYCMYKTSRFSPQHYKNSTKYKVIESENMYQIEGEAGYPGVRNSNVYKLGRISKRE